MWVHKYIHVYIRFWLRQDPQPPRPKTWTYMHTFPNILAKNITSSWQQCSQGRITAGGTTSRIFSFLRDINLLASYFGRPSWMHACMYAYTGYTVASLVSEQLLEGCVIPQSECGLVSRTDLNRGVIPRVLPLIASLLRSSHGLPSLRPHNHLTPTVILRRSATKDGIKAHCHTVSQSWNKPSQNDGLTTLAARVRSWASRPSSKTSLQLASTSLLSTVLHSLRVCIFGVVRVDIHQWKYCSRLSLRLRRIVRGNSQSFSRQWVLRRVQQFWNGDAEEMCVNSFTLQYCAQSECCLNTSQVFLEKQNASSPFLGLVPVEVIHRICFEVHTVLSKSEDRKLVHKMVIDVQHGQNKSAVTSLKQCVNHNVLHACEYGLT